MKILRSSTRAMRVAACLLCLAFVNRAEDHKPIAADRAAFAAARGQADPQAKVEALRRFLVQYPKSSRTGSANDLILETLVKSFPTHTAEIDAQVNSMLKEAKSPSRMFDYDNVASTLAERNVLLPRAEQISRKSLKFLNRKAYMENIRKQYVRVKMKPPSDSELRQDYNNAHSTLQGTLGRIYVKEDKVAEGEAELKSAYADNPNNSAASATLGMLAAKAGNNDLALTYLTRARLTGKLEDLQQQQLEMLYAKKHGVSSEGLETYLDESYARSFSPPFEVEKYKASAPSSRTVLAELFTGSGCDPCAGADLAIDGVLERYSRKELAVLELDQHIPEPDPLSNPTSVKRFGFYQAEGTPTLALDGNKQIVGAERNGAKSRFEAIDKQVQTDLALPAEAAIQLTAWRKGDEVMVHTSLSDMKGDSRLLTLQIALVEDHLRYSGENGIRFHHMVVRSMAKSGDGFPIEAGKDCDTSYAFDVVKISDGLKTYLDAYEKANDRFGPITFIKKMYAIDASDLSVVAFVQDQTTKHVLQAAYVKVTDKP